MHSNARLRVLTWHVHGNYLWYLSQTPHDFYVPFKAGRPHPYGGRAGTFPWPSNLHEIPSDAVRRTAFDCVLFQQRRNYTADQFEILSPAQRQLPGVYLEHDPPLDHPFAQLHPVDDPSVLVVHVTSWNAEMWDSGRSPVRVIEHGVLIPGDVRFTGELPRGVCAINHLRGRGRRMGADVFTRVGAHVPIDLVGMDAESLGGIGEIDPPQLAAFQARYRFAFSPIRQTSLGLALLEAMMIGLPIVGLATCELAAVIRNGESGFIDTSLDRVADAARGLLADRGEAQRLGEGARKTAMERYNIQRFTSDWDAVLREVAA
ncbi:MAG: biosynthesis transferase [Gemmatimonadetes bacterium]|nr:biosynthesis transferase [Gemmatimonadota bacterium]